MSDNQAVSIPEVPEAQATLDIGFDKIDINFVDEKQPLVLPNNPLHHKAHRLQLLLERLDKQAANRPTNFSSNNYLQILNEYYACVEKIIADARRASPTEVLDAPGLADSLSGSQSAGENGDPVPHGLDFGVPTENPFSG